ncbi:putative Hemerythrin HHE cation binding region [Magnetofaba australis IT-1]|uniref:Putative Hemerythrin HHE cation binding region n=1 Tax=Magnetofaba australis IT-1 TaxID=1434232 RepID=A0A1Y2K265_9PROT|nr:putative Hemerythrin HHE cation binding region [Magnetofaba australis IT-1]
MLNDFLTTPPTAEPAQLVEQIKRMAHSAQAHFLSEEKFLTDQHYPRLQAHRNAHARLLRRMGLVIRELSSSVTPIRLLALKVQLKDALARHIRHEDLDYARIYCDHRPNEVCGVTDDMLDWSQELSLGAPTLDREHGELARTLNAFYCAAIHEAYGIDPSPFVRKIQTRFQAHFEHEKELLERYAPELAAVHLADHDSFSQSLDGALSALSDPEDRIEDLGALFDALQLWFIRHTLTADLELAERLPNELRD